MGKNLHLVGCATVCVKSEVMLIGHANMSKDVFLFQKSIFFQWHQFQRRRISTRWFLLIISSFYCFTFFWPSREFSHLKKSMTCTPLIFNLIQKNLGTWKLSITFSAYFQSLHCQQIFQLLRLHSETTCKRCFWLKVSLRVYSKLLYFLI